MPKKYSDKALWKLYEEMASTTKMARVTGMSDRQIRRRLAEIRHTMGKTVKTEDVDRAGRLEQLISSIPLEGPAGARLKEAAVKLYGVAAKDELTQQIVTEGLDATSAVYRFDKPAIVIEPVETEIRSYFMKSTGWNATDETYERVFIIGDQQLGYWAVLDDEDPTKFHFEPFHDERAIDVMLQAIALHRPHRIVIIGDFFDFPQLSRFQQEPQYGQTMQATIQRGYDLLRSIRATAGDDCAIDFIPGNHETRMQRAIVNNNPALANLRRPGEKYSIYSVPGLMKFEQLNIECAAEFPSGEVWLRRRQGDKPGIVCTHADPNKKDIRADAIYGHLVMPGINFRQVHEQDGPVTFTLMCVSGCGNYSDTTDKVRLTRTNTPSGRARMSAVQSFGTIEISRVSGGRHYDLHVIDNGVVEKFMGQRLESKV